MENLGAQWNHKDEEEKRAARNADDCQTGKHSINPEIEIVSRLLDRGAACPVTEHQFCRLEASTIRNDAGSTEQGVPYWHRPKVVSVSSKFTKGSCSHLCVLVRTRRLTCVCARYLRCFGFLCDICSIILLDVQSIEIISAGLQIFKCTLMLNLAIVS